MTHLYGIAFLDLEHAMFVDSLSVSPRLTNLHIENPNVGRMEIGVNKKARGSDVIIKILYHKIIPGVQLEQMNLAHNKDSVPRPPSLTSGRNLFRANNTFNIHTVCNTHPCNSLFTLLPSGKQYRSIRFRTNRLQSSFFPQAVRLLNSSSTLHHN